jgi:hypothetical protein
MKQWPLLGSLILALIIFFASIPIAYADSWLPPKTRTHVSESGDAWLTIVPASHTQRLCHGQLFKKTMLRDATQVWSLPLVNPVAPMDALFSADGYRVVTFDNYGNLGFGREVVVFYNEMGHLLKQYALEDLLTVDEIAQVDRTVSSRWWRGKSSIDEELGIVEVEVRLGDKKNRTLKWIRFQLSDGELINQ